MIQPKLTRTQKKVIDRLRELGGKAYMGRGVDKKTQTINLAAYIRTAVAYDKTQGRLLSNRLKRLGITSKAVWATTGVITSLRKLNLIEHIDLAPGAYRLIEEK